LFHHFPSKDVLYAAVLERLLAPLGDAINRAVRTEGSFPERLDAMSDAVNDALGSHPFTARLIVREAMDLGPVARDKLSKVILEVLDGASQFAKAGQDAGAFVETDPKQAILSILGIHFLTYAVEGIVERYVGHSPFDAAFIATRREAVREQVRQLVLKRKK
jgi:AcrR family transcriptional regulator